MPTKLVRRVALAVALSGCEAAPVHGDGATADILLLPDAVISDTPAAISDMSTADADAPAAMSDDAPAGCGVCATAAEPVTTGTVDSSDLDELSGIVESRAQPGVYFVHNDSGDTARFFAVDDRGALRGTYVLDGVTAVDWEDLAVGPCPAGQCLYLADIGDNDRVRSGYAVYRVAQPVVGPGPAVRRSVPWERLAFGYPDGAHNAESLAVRPDTGDVYVITKVTSGVTEVYRFPQPLSVDARATLVRVGALALPSSGDPLVTGADLHPCARRLLVRTYNRLWEFGAAEGAEWETIFRATPQRLLVSNETQGEAVGWHSDGRGYVTISEGRTPALHDARCVR